jgi:hypothetical protein
MKLTLLMLATLALASPAFPQSKDESRLSQLASAIRAADYRGEREELRRLASALDDVKDSKLAAYRDYWRGFALWRRALNGMNETPTPNDAGDDLKHGVASFRASLEHRPDWIEAKVGLFGCWAALMSLDIDARQKSEILSAAIPVVKELKEKGAENPRALWLVGGTQLWSPRGSDPSGASATYRRGLAAAGAESLRNEKPADWVPAWGAPELLMTLAFVYSNSALRNRDVAQAYADGALAAVPDWHYVRDILVPQIQALSAPAK